MSTDNESERKPDLDGTSPLYFLYLDPEADHRRIIDRKRQSLSPSFPDTSKKAPHLSFEKTYHPA